MIQAVIQSNDGSSQTAVSNHIASPGRIIAPVMSSVAAAATSFYVLKLLMINVPDNPTRLFLTIIALSVCFSAGPIVLLRDRNSATQVKYLLGTAAVFIAMVVTRI